MKKGFILGVVAGLTIAGAPMVAASSQIQAILNDKIKVSLNGQVQEFRDETTNEIQYPITYKNRTYLPLRTVANLVGVGVDYDEKSDTAILKRGVNDNKTEYTSYDEVIDAYKKICQNKELAYDDKFSHFLFNPYINAYGLDFEEARELSYCLMDLNGDKVDELVIYSANNKNELSDVVAIYGLNDNHVCLYLTAYQRGNMTLNKALNTDSIIIHYSAGGMGEAVESLYIIDMDNQLNEVYRRQDKSYYLSELGFTDNEMLDMTLFERMTKFPIVTVQNGEKI